MSAEFTDYRGTIRDLIVSPIDSITEIISRQGAVRGNHVHHRTIQWTYIVSGKLRVVTPAREEIIEARQMWIDPPGTPHAWEALEGTVCLVFTQGPRSGENYEQDTIRLTDPLIR